MQPFCRAMASMVVVAVAAGSRRRANKEKQSVWCSFFDLSG
jgi:hypothetical protein